METRYQPTIGLEIHAELATKTKMFCSCSNDETQLTPNTNVCPVCLGHPGTLPVPNQTAIDMVVKTGLALQCAISRASKFDRKNYFYPDLPKAYQISQYDQPLCEHGSFTLPTGGVIRIKRIHLEEDAAGLSHSADNKHSLVDFNRAGVPLMELVTEPDFHTADDAVLFAQELQLLLRYLEVSDGDMEKGHMRIEANISIAPQGSDKLGTKVEVKNLNSFRAVKRAIAFEIHRHEKMLLEDRHIDQETRGWNDEKQETFSQRSKEEAHDYRYFPEPDIPPLVLADEYIERIRASVGELPWEKRKRFSHEYNLSDTQSEFLVQDEKLSAFFEHAVSELNTYTHKIDIQLLFNYLASDAQGLATDRGMPIYVSRLTPAHLAQLVAYVSEEKISSRVAKDVLARVFDGGQSPQDIITTENLFQVSDVSALESIVRLVIDQNDKAVLEYKQGKLNALQFLMGKVMAQSKGAANPDVVKTILAKLLNM